MGEEDNRKLGTMEPFLPRVIRLRAPVPDSITHCFQKLQAGNPDATQVLWQAYFGRLVALARKKMEGRVRRMNDEEDVALSAFYSFCRGVEGGRYPQIHDRNDLWNLLVSITLHKALHVLRDEGRKKRGGDVQIYGNHSEDSEVDLLEQMISHEPTPEVAVQFVEDVETLLNQLPNQELVDLALLKMDGYTNAEIAEQWKKAERTVERKLNLIRKIWAQELR